MKIFLKKSFFLSVFFFPVVLFCFPVHNTGAAVIVRFAVWGNNLELDKYKTDLIKLILDNSELDYDLYYCTYPGGHGLQIERLKKGLITVQSFGASKQLEEELIPIRIPIFKGLAGYRIFLINKNDQYKFQKIDRLEDLKELVGILGEGWLDIQILQDAGLPQKTTEILAIYKMLNRGGRIDYFSRAIYETFGEFQMLKSSYPNLAIEKRILLIYPFAMYFYVSPKYPEIAEKLNAGFHKLVQNGEFDKFFYKNNYIRSSIINSQLDKRIKFHIPNNYLSLQTQNLPGKYWFNMNIFLEYKDH